MKIHSALGPGFLETVYENALLHELRKCNLQFESQKRLPVYYDGVMVGDFVADMIVNGSVILETKAVASVTQAHEVQLVNYLSATGIEIGLLLNFGAASLQFRRKHRTYIPTKSKRPVE